MRKSTVIACTYFFVIFLTLFSGKIYGQSLLNKKMTVHYAHQSLKKVLSNIGEKGGFYFSYNSNVVPGDSLVTISVVNKKLENILKMLLGNAYEFTEKDNYIIIRKYGKDFTISGYIINKETGEKIPNVSVYVPKQFASSLTNSVGYFELRLHNSLPKVVLKVSRINFNDTTYALRSGINRQISIAISPKPVKLKTVIVRSNMDRTFLGRIFISSMQRMRDLNLSNFLMKQPVQYSIWPSLGTHGKLSAQVKNNFSLNLGGGYTAGTNGFEFSGLFAMDKNNVRGAQVAGLFNIVGKKMNGFQISGIYNNVGDSITGMQIAGIINKTQSVNGWQFSGIGNINKKALNGIQISGIFNKAQSTKGLQFAGVVNISNKDFKGIQLAGVLNKVSNIEGLQFAGVVNISKQTVNGGQLAGVLNYTHNLNGFQIGLINISDSSSGYSLGLINIVRENGYYKLSFSWKNKSGFNIAFKSGRRKFYNILSIGYYSKHNNEVFSVGYGIGKEIPLASWLSLTTELIEQNYVIGYKNDVPVLVQLQPSFQFRLTRGMTVFAGPVCSLYFAGSSAPSQGTEDILLPKNHIKIYNFATGWLGFQVGINLF